MRIFPLPVVAVLVLLLAGCSNGVETLKSEGEPPVVTSSEELAVMVDDLVDDSCEFDHHNETVGAADSATCTVEHGSSSSPFSTNSLNSRWSPTGRAIGNRWQEVFPFSLMRIE